MNSPNAQYNVAAPDSFAIRVATAMRAKMYDVFATTFDATESSSVLDVGATSDTSYSSSNYFEALYPYKSRIVAAGIDDASFLAARYDGLQVVRADGCALPFRDSSFDFVHSSAVIEHVGSAANQRQFVRELIRVARTGVFITTPNRWYPIEFHTLIPLLHWLPRRAFRSLLRATGDEFFSDEANLNLLSMRELESMVGIGEATKVETKVVRLLGLPSNLMLCVHKAIET